MPDTPSKRQRPQKAANKQAVQKVAPASAELLILSPSPPPALAKGEGERVVYVETFDLR